MIWKFLIMFLELATRKSEIVREPNSFHFWGSNFFFHSSWTRLCFIIGFSVLFSVPLTTCIFVHTLRMPKFVHDHAIAHVAQYPAVSGLNIKWNDQNSPLYFVKFHSFVRTIWFITVAQVTLSSLAFDFFSIGSNMAKFRRVRTKRRRIVLGWNWRTVALWSHDLESAFAAWESEFAFQMWIEWKFLVFLTRNRMKKNNWVSVQLFSVVFVVSGHFQNSVMFSQSSLEFCWWKCCKQW